MIAKRPKVQPDKGAANIRFLKAAPKLLAFDLDDTLAITKSAISDSLASILGQLLELFDICVISGGRWQQFETQLIDRLRVPHELLTKLHLLPTSGTRYYVFNSESCSWVEQYAEDLTEDEKDRSMRVLTEGAKALELWETNPDGTILEDRGSQITFSALGQLAPAERKYAWDPDGSKKRQLREYAAQRLPDLAVRAGGSTSVDVTRKGIDKAYGMRRLMDILDLGIGDVVFFGDQMQEGGNDAPVPAMGIRSVAVLNSHETEVALTAILALVGHA